MGLDVINYNVIKNYSKPNSYNWTEADMVFFPKGLRPRRVDYRYSVEKHGGFTTENNEMEASYTFFDYIESYNRLYHFPDRLKWYTYKTGLAYDDDGNQIFVTDPRTGEEVP